MYFDAAVHQALRLKAAAAKEMEAIGTKRDRQQIVRRIQVLAAEPRAAGCEKLAGHSTLFRVRQGPFRVIYSANDAQQTVDVVKVGHRWEVYRSTS